MPRDWALRPSYDTRVAIINAMYACGENVQKLMPVLLTEAVRRDRQGSPSNCHPKRICFYESLCSSACITWVSLLQLLTACSLDRQLGLAKA